MLHAGQRLLARSFGGSYGRADTIPFIEPEVGEADCNRIRLSYLRWPGRGPTLVLVHGLNNNAWIWARVAMQLNSEGGDVIAVTLRGHGSSDKPDADYSLQATTRDLRALLDTLTEGPVDLAGHSWGGKAVLHLAAVAGKRVRRVVLADPASPQGLNPLLTRVPRLLRAAFKPERGPFTDRAALEAAARKITYLRFDDEIDRRLWQSNFEQQPDGRFVHCLAEPHFLEILETTLAEDITPLLPRVACPVQLLRPTLSVGFWPGELRPLQRGLGDRLSIAAVPGDHSFIHSNPLDTAAAMLRFPEESR